MVHVAGACTDESDNLKSTSYYHNPEKDLESKGSVIKVMQVKGLVAKVNGQGIDSRQDVKHENQDGTSNDIGQRCRSI